MESARARILVVEDEPAIRRGLCDVLAWHGFAPTPVETGEEGLEQARGPEIDLVLLDVMLPGVSGFEVCRALREERPELPILLLTARGAEADVLEGFACGSDDYVTKPFSVSEIVARVEALLRRSGRDGASVTPPFSIGRWEVEPARLVAHRDGVEVALTRRELALLSLLARERGRIVSRGTLLREVWQCPRPERLETRTVDVHVAKLRRKLGDGQRLLIETVRGEGYRLADADSRVLPEAAS